MKRKTNTRDKNILITVNFFHNYLYILLWWKIYHFHGRLSLIIYITYSQKKKKKKLYTSLPLYHIWPPPIMERWTWNSWLVSLWRGINKRTWLQKWTKKRRYRCKINGDLQNIYKHVRSFKNDWNIHAPCHLGLVGLFSQVPSNEKKEALGLVSHFDSNPTWVFGNLFSNVLLLDSIAILLSANC